MKPSPDAHPSLRQAEHVYRQLVRHDLCEDLPFGLNFGFYRTFGIPEIATLLVSTGKVTGQTELRHKTTGLMMHQLYAAGLDSDLGTRTVATLNRIHSRWPLTNDAFRYVLACFDVAPLRWCDTYAWRSTTPAEKNAAHTFYLGLADRMHIRDVPPTWNEFRAWADDFEQRHFAHTPQSAELWSATRGMLIRRFFPTALHPFVGAAADALLDAPLRKAVGVNRPPAPIRAMVAVGMRTRAHRLRRAHTASHYRPNLPPAIRALE